MKPIKAVDQRVFNFLRNKLSRPQYVTLVAILTGLVSGMVAVLLKTFVHYLQKTAQTGSWLYLALPAAGLLLTVIITVFAFGGATEKGIGMMLKAIAKKSSYIPADNIFGHFITSSQTVGLGGSAGLAA